jgi:CDP-diacylglycerol--glycerol-3-phosphate 3-phosphatidyltransferase
MRPELAFLGIVIAVALATMPLFAYRSAGGAGDSRDLPDRGTFVLGGFIRAWFYWFIGPVERLALAMGLSPLFFNLAGVALGAVGGVAFGLGRPVLGGWGVLLGGMADVLDGRIARARGLASPRGAFLDSTLDRFAEVGVFVGLAVYFHGNPWITLFLGLALGGSLLVSYTRARGESQGVVCKVGLMQRAERLLLLGFGGLLDPAVASWTGGRPGTLLTWVIILIALGTIGTSIFRTVWIATRLPAEGG